MLKKIVEKNLKNVEKKIFGENRKKSEKKSNNILWCRNPQFLAA
jgi:hypothetical protein